MTIVASKETRNAEWAASSSFGRKMLEKMGWKGEGVGLGKNQQGTSTHLRAVRRADSLGIGAETDAFGEKGWEDSARGYKSVLASLTAEYGAGSSGGDDEDKKKEKKKRKKEKKLKAKNAARGGNNVSRPSNRVQAGHARKMRDAKCLSSKSHEDMAAIFGVKADKYKPSDIFSKLAESKSVNEEVCGDRENSSKEVSDEDLVESDSKKKQRKEAKKAKRNKSVENATKDKKKRKHEDDSDSVEEVKRKKKKTKK